MATSETETTTVVKRILPYMRRRLYDPEVDMDYEASVQRAGTYKKGYVDIIVHDHAKRPQFVIEAKRSSKRLTDKDRNQALSYGLALKVPFVVATNGRDIRCFNTTNSKAIQWNGKLIGKIPTKNQLPGVLKKLKSNPHAIDIPLKSSQGRGFDESLPFRPGLPLTKLNKLFSRCHNTIRKIEKDEDHAFADLSKFLFLKLLEEKHDQNKGFKLPYTYRFHELAEIPDDKADQVKNSIEAMLHAIDQSKYKNILVTKQFQAKRKETFRYIVRELANVSFADSVLDTNGAAFEYFVRATLKGKRLGQYFTPRPVVEMMATLVGRHAIINGIRSSNKMRVIDPACGTGGFLIYLLKDQLAELDRLLAAGEIPHASYNRCAKKLMRSTFYGSDANEGVASAAKMNMIIAGDGHTNIRSEDTLTTSCKIWTWKRTANYILTNPPFGTSELDSLSEDDLATFPLPSPAKGQHLFLQRMVRSTKTGGIICTVIDEGVLNTESACNLRRWMAERVEILAVVSLPAETFQPNKINVRSSVLLMKRLRRVDVDLDRDHRIAFIDVQSLGYDGSGEAIRGFDFDKLRDQLYGVVWQPTRSTRRKGYHWTAFYLPLSKWSKDPTHRLDYKYWEPSARTEISRISRPRQTVSHLNLIATRRGKSPSADQYVDKRDGYAVVIKSGSNITKFGQLDIATADYVEESTYAEIPDRAKLQHGDVLLSSTGTGTLGKACVYDLKDPAIADSHITIIRPDGTKVDPYYLADVLRVGCGRTQTEQLYTGSTGLIELTADHVDSIIVPLGSGLQDQSRQSKELRTAEKTFLRNAAKATESLEESRQSFKDG
ncbi:MAG: N-6 DNA methylase [Acidimicrobiaceae bacterium]|nr:N-6 DNA methylase [Acidimicrobiaceae bacterium]